MVFLKLTNDEKTVIQNNIHIMSKVHNYVDYKSKVCVKPWGYEFLAYESEKIGIWILSINQGHQTSMHSHLHKDTILVVLNGCIKIDFMDGSKICSQMSVTFIPKQKFHSIISLTDNVSIMEIEIFSKCVTFSDKNDVLRIDDVYNREKTGYENSVSISYDLHKYNYFYLSDNFKNDYLKIIITNDCHPILLKSSIYIILEGTIYNNGIYMKEGSCIQSDMINDNTIINANTILLEINKPYFEENVKLIYNIEQLKHIVKQHSNEKRILTSGCFDILHIGHLHTLKQAKLLGDKLFVCLSNDNQIKSLKGNDRPINNYNDRIELFKTIQYVDYVILYDEEDVQNETTLDKIINITRPLYWVKGSDYKANEILLKHPSVNIKLIDNLPYISTTNIISNIKQK
jgi:rfaE bifunctional protein nucleotidyltransferase chain/domain